MENKLQVKGLGLNGEVFFDKPIKVCKREYKENE